MKNKFEDISTLKGELKRGNADAIAYLMSKYHHSLCVYAYSLTNDNDEAKDIVQDVFLKFWEKRERVTSVKSIKNYLYKSVYNGFLYQYRKNSKLLVFEKEYIEALDSIVKLEDEALLQKQIRLVKVEIEKLPLKCKKVFLMSKQEGLTHIEIADYLNISTKTVENHITKAFKVLRLKLKDEISPILFLLFGFELSFKD